MDRQAERAHLVWRTPVRHHRGDVTSNVGMKVNLFLPQSRITSNPFTYDALPHVQTQTNRGQQYVPATFPHVFPIDDATNVPGLEAKQTLLSPFNEVVSYETYRLKDKCSVLYASEGGEINRLKKRFGGLLPTLREFDGKKPIALLTFLSELREGLNAL